MGPPAPCINDVKLSLGQNSIPLGWGFLLTRAEDLRLNINRKIGDPAGLASANGKLSRGLTAGAFVGGGVLLSAYRSFCRARK